MEKQLTYGQAMTLATIEDEVKKHIKDNYPQYYYGNSKKNILGTYGHSLSRTSWLKIHKLAKKDNMLSTLVMKYITFYESL
jgi:hypothetical protein